MSNKKLCFEKLSGLAMIGGLAMINPYEDLPDKAYWRTAVANGDFLRIPDIYKKKWKLSPDMGIATAGSCFAQHITRELRKAGFKLLDVEPAPAQLPQDKHADYQFSLYSARYGNIYTSRQLLELAEEAFGLRHHAPIIWEKNGRYYDALRPGVEKNGLRTQSEVIEHRKYHIDRVRSLFLEMDVFIFTLGLTETWIDLATDRALPMAPGTIAGSCDPKRYRFFNLNYLEIMDHLLKFEAIVNDHRKKPEGLKFILTVSPVPLTATGGEGHVLSATTYSKSTLRAVAGDLCATKHQYDYFPSYEIITNPLSRSMFYKQNLREIRSGGVKIVMDTFFGEHALARDPEPVGLADGQSVPQATSAPIAPSDIQMALACEEASYDRVQVEAAQ